MFHHFRFRPLITVVVTASLLFAPAQAATIKVGALCTKVGEVKKVGSTTYQCVLSGKKKVWAKKSAAPTPQTSATPAPTPSVTTSITASATPSTTPTPSATASSTPTPSVTETPSPSPSSTPTPTPTPTPTSKTLTIYQGGAGKPAPVKTTTEKTSPELTFTPATAPTGTNLKVWIYDPEIPTKSLNSPGLFYRKLDGDWIYQVANSDGTVFLKLTAGSYVLNTVEPNGNTTKYSRKNYFFSIDDGGVASTTGLLPNSAGFFTLTIDLRANTTTVVATPSPSATFVPKNACQLQGQDGNLAMNQGFPHRSERLPSSGVIRAIIIPVDFPDVVGTGNPAQEYYAMAKGMDDFYRKVSDGRVSFTFQVLPSYLRMDFNSDKYKLGTWSGGDSVGYWRATLAAADPYVDYSLFDVVYVLSPRNIPSSSIAYGPAFPLRSDTNDGPVNNGTFSGADAYTNFPGADWKWISHETGHLFGLHDLYTVSPQAATYGSWDLMSLNWSVEAIELNSWNRYISDWLTENQIDCLTPDSLSASPLSRDLVPLVGNLAGQKAQFIRLSSSKILVAEYRTTGGLDVLPASREGVLVYTVDMTISSIKGGWQTQRRAGSSSPEFTDAALRVGDSVTIDSVKIEVNSLSSSSATIKVSKN